MRSFPPVSLIGAPTDIGAGDRGAGMGPEALRVAGIGRGAARARHRRRRSRQPRRPAQSVAAAGRRLSPSRTKSSAWNRAVQDAVGAELRGGPPADPARRRPLPGHRLDQRGRAPLPRHRQEAARAVARRARRLQHRTTSRRAATSTACRSRACAASAREELTEIGGSAPAISAEADPPDRHPLASTPGEKRLVHEARPRGLRHALHRRDRHAPRDGAGAGDGIDANTHLHVSFDVDFLDPSIAPGVGTTVPGRPELPRSAAVHGDDRRHRPPGLARHHGTQSRARHAQPTAELAVDLIESLFGKSTLMRD